MAGAAADQERPSTIIVTNETMTTDDTMAVDIVLTSAPDGLSGYYFDVIVENTGAAQFESASYPERFGLTSEPEVSMNGANITLEAADIDDSIQPGSSNVTLASVTVGLDGSGAAELSVRPRQFDDDSGDRFTPSTRSETVTGSTIRADETTNDQTNSDESAVSSSNTDDVQQSADSIPLPVSPILLAIMILSMLVVGLGVFVMYRL